jgi:hypothetical protein
MNPLVFEMISMEFCRATVTEKREGGGTFIPKERAKNRRTISKRAIKS